jgi:hypothetical protein
MEIDQIYKNSLILQLLHSSLNDTGSYACRVDDESGGRITSLMSLKIDRMLTILSFYN